MSSTSGRSLASTCTFDIRSDSGRSSSSYHSRVDSGYLSGSSHNALYDTLMLWREADDARRRLPEQEQAVAGCKKLLQEKREMEQNVASSSRSGKTKRKPSVLNLFKNSKHSGPSEEIQSVPPQPALTPISVLELQLKELTEQLESTQQLADFLDARYDALRACLEDGHIPLWHESDSRGRLGQAEKAVANREASYNGILIVDAIKLIRHHQSVEITLSLRRARHAVQSAHLHYRHAMDIVDSVCSPTGSKWGSAFGDEQSREQTYKDAASSAHKAQVCFNECLRALEPHLDLLQEDEVQACRDLQELGLLQAVRLYELMYGGKALAMGISGPFVHSSLDGIAR
ncbi:hypothetical protein CERSUDRAFT_99225 [Gelatoporia subvermispora B]|uniref:Uncharacterized protein n=1 Tax=Ceriporiopsis subvermispora (strain B) TaxID=914234 RepID=M2PAH0_CERS8|nr:hypothetical protein CERSUDRAFT_99225 [Gelatoporia subvermispora B]